MLPIQVPHICHHQTRNILRAANDFHITTAGSAASTLIASGGTYVIGKSAIAYFIDHVKEEELKKFRAKAEQEFEEKEQFDWLLYEVKKLESQINAEALIVIC